MCQFVFLLPFHPAVLEPDFDLSLRQIQCVRNFDSSSTSEIPIEMELLLKFQGLVAGVGCSGSLVGSIYAICKQSGVEKPAIQ